MGMWTMIIIIGLCSVALALYALRLHLVAWKLGLPQPRHRVVIQRDVSIPMRDGVKLAADLYQPRRQAKYPAVILRTPYEKGEHSHQYPFLGRFFASQGYVAVMQDTRGKHQSEGDFYPFAHEEADGVDTVDWVVQQPWSDGNVGSFGASYMGLTQWLSAPQQGPNLKAMVPIFISQQAYDIVRGNHGVFLFQDVLAWHWQNEKRHRRVEDPEDWAPALNALPVINADEKLGDPIPCYRDWVQHSHKDGYWGQWRVDNKVHLIKAPALIIGGWYDRFIEGSIESFQKMRAEDNKSRLIVGPWTHEPGAVFDEVSFGLEAGPWIQIGQIVSWYDWWLKGRQTKKEAPVRIFVMGKNKWRSENEWPLDRTDYQKVYLRADGALSHEPPAEEAPDHYRYDPMDPCPTIGGNSIYAKEQTGPRPQKEIESRSDVLVYSTPPLKKAVEVTGPITCTLYAATTAPDTDFTAKLCDVYPDGTSIHIKNGIVRARYRNSLSEPELLTPGAITCFEIQIGPTSMLFKKNHRIRLQISSSNFPEYTRNLNVAEDPHHTTNFRSADQTIYHSQEHPSHLTLPVIP